MFAYTKDRHTYDGSGVPEQSVSILHFEGVLRGRSQKKAKSRYSVNLEMAKAVYSNVGCSHSSRFHRCVHVLCYTHFVTISFPETTCLLVSTQDTEQFTETKILGLPVSRRMRGLVYMASRDKVDVDTFHKDIQYALEKLGKLKFGFERTTVLNFKSKTHEGSGNELVDYFRAPCLGADQKARGLWERD